MLKSEIISSIISKHRFINDAVVFSSSPEQFCAAIKHHIDKYFKDHPNAWKYYSRKDESRNAFLKLTWSDYAAIRIADMIDNEGRSFNDQNLHGAVIKSRPFTIFWRAISEDEEIARDLLIDLDKLFDQFAGIDEYKKPTQDDVEQWMKDHPSGLDKNIISKRQKNKDRIIKVIIKELENHGNKKGKYSFSSNMNFEDKYDTVSKWWNESSFHLTFAIRDTDLLNEMLDNSIDNETLEIMEEAESRGIPIFVNPYYLSLLNISKKKNTNKDDLAIRQYIFYSHALVDEFGQISAWEKEDITVPGEPNAAGWLLPSSNIHRRYPEVAILIPDTIGRACGGLCSSCQRMYGFQSGDFNFNLSKLEPKESWPNKLKRLLEYYENDSKLRDVLITGGDALMNTDKSLKTILDNVYDMAKRKKDTNRKRDNKFAEISRVRLGTRLPVYLPQRITDNLVKILNDFRIKASKIGIKQFVIQTHFESAMEITPEVEKAINMLLSSGWYVTNQMVFTSTAARKGHTAKLRKVLNDLGVLTYYTFSVKGYKENQYNFATNARAVQEQMEEKYLGEIPEELWDDVSDLTDDPTIIKNKINYLRDKAGLPFLSTDRNVINLPGIGKSQTFRTIGMTDNGRRILEFDYDHNRSHSPATNELGKVIIIESKTVSQFIRELHHHGCSLTDYKYTYGYSLSETEPLMPIFKYPKYNFELTEEFTNIEY